MMKKLSLIFAVGALSGCTNMDSTNWASSEDGCQKYFSETPKDLAACRSFVKNQQVTVADNHSAKNPSLAVTTTVEGTKVDAVSGIKEFERSEQNLTE